MLTRAWLATALLFMSADLISAQSIPGLGSKATPLHWAAEHGLYAIAEQLISNGALTGAPDQFGRAPLHLAVPYKDVVILLLGAGANVNTADMFGRTPLHLSLRYPATVAVLLDSGADVNAVDFLGKTPLDRALRYGTRSVNLTVIDLLLAAGSGAPDTAP